MNKIAYKIIGIVAVIVLIICSIVLYHNNKDIQKHTDAIKRHTCSIKGLDHKYKKIDSLPVNRTAYYDLYDKYAEVKNETITLHESILETNNHWIYTLLKFLTVLGGIIGFLGVRQFTINELAKVLGINKSKIKTNYDEFIKHQNLRKESKILILNKKGSNFPEEFKKVMSLFKVNLEEEEEEDVIRVTDLEEVLQNKDYKKRIKAADVLLIENQKGEWIIGQDKDKTLNQDEIDKNIQSLKEIADFACKTSGLFYYGNGQFPSNKVDPNLRHYISFANASAALYGNLLDLLKFRMELNKHP